MSASLGDWDLNAIFKNVLLVTHEKFVIHVEFNFKLLFLDENSTSHALTENQYGTAKLTVGLEKVSIAAH